MKKIVIEVSDKETEEFIATLNRCGCDTWPLTDTANPNSILYYIIYYDDDFEYQGIDCKEIDGYVVEEDYVLKYSDISFFRLPEKVQDDMVSRTSQKNCIGVILNLAADSFQGGFDWSKSPEGSNYWNRLYWITNKLNKKENENRFQEQESSLIRRGGESAAGIRCEGNKFRITVKHLSHREIIGRG